MPLLQLLINNFLRTFKHIIKIILFLPITNTEFRVITVLCFSKNIDKIGISKTTEVADLSSIFEKKGKGYKYGRANSQYTVQVRKKACRIINRGETRYTQVTGLEN